MCLWRLDPRGKRKGLVDRTNMEKGNSLEAGRGMAHQYETLVGRQGSMGTGFKDNTGRIRLPWDKRQQGWATVQGW